MKNKIKKCIICRKKYKEFGNNALPIIEGQCCDDCNSRLVVPLRIRIHFAFEKYREEILEAEGIKK